MTESPEQTSTSTSTTNTSTSTPSEPKCPVDHKAGASSLWKALGFPHPEKSEPALSPQDLELQRRNLPHHWKKRPNTLRHHMPISAFLFPHIEFIPVFLEEEEEEVVAMEHLQMETSVHHIINQVWMKPRRGCIPPNNKYSMP